MFKWLKKYKRKEQNEKNLFKQHSDSLEASLWEIKEEFDLNTEEIEKVVIEKRHNVDYMNECLKSKK